MNAYLFFGTFWRLAGLRSGDLTAYDLTNLTSGSPPVLYPKGKDQQDED